MRLGKHIDKKTDNWSDKSNKKLSSGTLPIAGTAIVSISLILNPCDFKQ